jgi:hypothetical protein
LWFSTGTPVSFNDKIDHHDIAEILLKVALNTITLTLTLIIQIRTVISYFTLTLIFGFKTKNEEL